VPRTIRVDRDRSIGRPRARDRIDARARSGSDDARARSTRVRRRARAVVRATTTVGRMRAGARAARARWTEVRRRRRRRRRELERDAVAGGDESALFANLLAERVRGRPRWWTGRRALRRIEGKIHVIFALTSTTARSISIRRARAYDETDGFEDDARALELGRRRGGRSRFSFLFF
jgi:hypothetical protein